MMERLDDHLIEIMTTLIAVYGAYLFAEHFHVSGVIAADVRGLIVGNRGLMRTSSSSRQSMIGFWEVIAFLVNSAVFLLIGFELRPDRLAGNLLAAAVIFVVVLAVRAGIVYSLGALLHHQRRDLPVRWRHVILLGGMRGAVPIALALGLPVGLSGRSDLVAIVFGVVLFSLLGRGLSMPRLLQKLELQGSGNADG
jgi:CPA1 family monovalent cation:H+ antiporter